MRGKLPSNSFLFLLVGITPADAGKTLLRSCVIVGVEDHPRGCGENARASLCPHRFLGSPPRMRGKHIYVGCKGACTRITPADAGKTALHTRLPLQTEDHPRGCGENGSHHALANGDYGSPPRMRGKLIYPIASIPRSRITPADAGKTLKRSFRNQPFCS